MTLEQLVEFLTKHGLVLKSASFASVPNYYGQLGMTAAPPGNLVQSFTCEPEKL